MATIVLRGVKGSPLTNTEADANFSNINSEVGGHISSHPAPTTRDARDLPVVQSAYNQIADASIASGTYTFNFANGDMQQLTATGNFTVAFSNFISGKVCTMLIDAINWGNFVVTFPVATLFNAKVAPVFTKAGMDRLMIIKDKDNIYSIHIVGQQIGEAQ